MKKIDKDILGMLLKQTTMLDAKFQGAPEALAKNSDQPVKAITGDAPKNSSEAARIETNLSANTLKKTGAAGMAAWLGDEALEKIKKQMLELMEQGVWGMIAALLIQLVMSAFGVDLEKEDPAVTQEQMNIKPNLTSGDIPNGSAKLVFQPVETLKLTEPAVKNLEKYISDGLTPEQLQKAYDMVSRLYDKGLATNVDKIKNTESVKDLAVKMANDSSLFKFTDETQKDRVVNAIKNGIIDTLSPNEKIIADTLIITSAKTQVINMLIHTKFGETGGKWDAFQFNSFKDNGSTAGGPFQIVGSTAREIILSGKNYDTQSLRDLSSTLIPALGATPEKPISQTDRVKMVEELTKIYGDEAKANTVADALCDPNTPGLKAKIEAMYLSLGFPQKSIDAILEENGLFDQLGKPNSAGKVMGDANALAALIKHYTTLEGNMELSMNVFDAKSAQINLEWKSNKDLGEYWITRNIGDFTQYRNALADPFIEKLKEKYSDNLEFKEIMERGDKGEMLGWGIRNDADTYYGIALDQAYHGYNNSVEKNVISHVVNRKSNIEKLASNSEYKLNTDVGVVSSLEKSEVARQETSQNSQGVLKKDEPVAVLETDKFKDQDLAKEAKNFENYWGNKLEQGGVSLEDKGKATAVYLAYQTLLENESMTSVMDHTRQAQMAGHLFYKQILDENGGDVKNALDQLYSYKKMDGDLGMRSSMLMENCLSDAKKYSEIPLKEPLPQNPKELYDLLKNNNPKLLEMQPGLVEFVEKNIKAIPRGATTDYANTYYLNTSDMVAYIEGSEYPKMTFTPPITADDLYAGKDATDFINVVDYQMLIKENGAKNLSESIRLAYSAEVSEALLKSVDSTKGSLNKGVLQDSIETTYSRLGGAPFSTMRALFSETELSDKLYQKAGLAILNDSGIDKLELLDGIDKFTKDPEGFFNDRPDLAREYMKFLEGDLKERIAKAEVPNKEITLELYKRLIDPETGFAKQELGRVIFKNMEKEKPNLNQGTMTTKFDHRDSSNNDLYQTLNFLTNASEGFLTKDSYIVLGDKKISVASIVDDRGNVDKNAIDQIKLLLEEALKPGSKLIIGKPHIEVDRDYGGFITWRDEVQRAATIVHTNEEVKQNRIVGNDFGM